MKQPLPLFARCRQEQYEQPILHFPNTGNLVNHQADPRSKHGLLGFELNHLPLLLTALNLEGGDVLTHLQLGGGQKYQLCLLIPMS